MFRLLDTDETWIVMPNHIHGIVANDQDKRGEKPLGRQIGGFKTLTTNRINQFRNSLGHIVRQRNFYEHIIRDERSFDRIVEYICANPARWNEDPENPHSTARDIR